MPSSSESQVEAGPRGDASTGQRDIAGPAARRREALVLASVQFTSIVDFMVLMPLGPQLKRALQISSSQFGLIVACYTISAGVAGLLASSILDRFGRKSAFLTLYAGFLVGTLFCGLSRGYSTLLAARVVTGAFGGILGGMALAIIGDVFPENRRGQATGVLMSAFALASVVGVPIGLSLGTKLGWHVPFLILAGLGAPVLLISLRALPPLRDHLHLSKGPHAHPWAQVRETFTHPNHLRAFALMTTLMLGGFAVIPYVSVYLVANVGVKEPELPLVYVTGGVLTLLGAPLIGRWADHYGKLPVYRVVAVVSAFLMIAVTNLPRLPLAVAVGVVGALMLANAGRMVAAMSMIAGSVEARRRGGFMSANSAVQHIATGLGSWIGSLIIGDNADGTIRDFDKVGLVAVAATVLSIWLAGRVRPAQVANPATAVEPILDDPLAAAELL